MLAAAYCSALYAYGLLSVSVPSSPALHEFKIRTLYHQGINARGAALDVQVQGADRPVKLLLDTGANDIVLWSRSARKIGLHQPAEAPTGFIGGFNGETSAAWGLVTSIQIGPEFLLNDVRVQVMDHVAMRDIDGVIGANVFRNFVLELDPARGRMRLLAGFGEAAPGELVPFEQVGHLVFVRTGCNAQREIGLALLDTGSSYSAIDVAKTGKVTGPSGRDFVPLRGVTGDLSEAAYQLPPVRFELLGSATAVWDREPMAMNLSEMSRTHGVNVRAVIGFPAISHSILQLDYSSKRLRIVTPR